MSASDDIGLPREAGPSTVVTQAPVTMSPNRTNNPKPQSLSLPHSVEMSDLSNVQVTRPLQQTTRSDVPAHDSIQKVRAENPVTYMDMETTQSISTRNPISPTQTESAIGPATDGPTPIPSTASPGPQLIITLLLHSTETRHPYIINEKYLKRRNVNVAENDPTNMSVYTLKELIWRDWREGMLDDLADLHELVTDVMKNGSRGPPVQLQYG